MKKKQSKSNPRRTPVSKPKRATPKPITVPHAHPHPDLASEVVEDELEMRDAEESASEIEQAEQDPNAEPAEDIKQ